MWRGTPGRGPPSPAVLGRTGPGRDQRAGAEGATSTPVPDRIRLEAAGRLLCSAFRSENVPLSGTQVREKMKPFQQWRFEDLPELPRIPHPYFTARSEDVSLDSVAFGQIRLRVVTHGEGRPLLLLHGLMTSSYSWRYLLEPLGERFSLVIPDLPGSAGSPPLPERAHSPAALATLLGELQDHLAITGCPAVGNSLGGYVCMERALRSPGSFSSLVVIHAPAVPQRRLQLLHLAMKLPGVASGLTWWIRRDPLRFAHKNVHYYDETLKSLEEARMYGEPLATRPGAASFVRYLTDALDPGELSRFAEELARRRDGGESFPAPLLLVYARQDPIIPPTVGPKLHALIPEAGFEWFEESSHFVQVEKPDRLAPLLTEFLLAR